MTRALACALLLLASAPACGQQADDDVLRGCELVDFLELERGPLYACADGRYIATAADDAGRLTVIATGPLPEGFRRFVEEPGGRVAPEVERYERVPLSRLRPAGARVAEVRPREVVLDGYYFAPGEPVALVELDRRGRERLMAVGRAREREGASAVELGFGEVVRPGARARPTELPVTADPWAPPRFGDLWQLALGTRAFVPLTDPAVGLGFAGGAAIRYRARFPFVITTEFSPFAWDELFMAAVGVAMLGFDLPMFEVSAGAALPTRSGGAQCCADFVIAAAQRVRLGALDGLSLEATAVEGFEDGFRLHSMLVRLLVPLEALGVLRDAWLVAQGGGGAAGYGLGEVGVRLLLHGGGWKGTVFLTVMAGGLGVFREARTFAAHPFPVERIGPSLGLDFEARL